MNHCFYCLDGLWNVKAKYIVLYLNALAKLQNPKGVSRPPALMGYYSVVCTIGGGGGGGGGQTQKKKQQNEEFETI